MFGRERQKKKEEDKFSSPSENQTCLSQLHHTDHGCEMRVNFGTDLFYATRWWPFIDRSSIAINTGVFPGKMCSDWCKNHSCGQKKPEGTSSAMFGIGNASKCCELKRCIL